jgi:UDP-glucose 4-epimerase
MKIAITGGAGFIGSHLTQAYLDAGHDVLVIDSLVNGSRQAIDRRARFYHIDIRDPQLQTILQRERPDIVSHHASHQPATGMNEHTLADADVHVRGLLNILDSCVNASVQKCIFASSGNSLYEQRDTAELQPLRESNPLYPRNAQDISKVAGEWYLRYYTQQYGLKHTILRYADTYGDIGKSMSNEQYHAIHYYITMLMAQRRPIIHGTGAAMRDHIFIDDVIHANLKALNRGDNQTLHISSGQGYSYNQLYHKVASIMNSPLEPVYLTDSRPTPSCIILDNTNAHYQLDWQPTVSLTDGINLTLQRLHAMRQPAEQHQTLRTEVFSSSPVLLPTEIIATEATLTHV